MKFRKLSQLAGAELKLAYVCKVDTLLEIFFRLNKRRINNVPPVSKVAFLNIYYDGAYFKIFPLMAQNPPMEERKKCKCLDLWQPGDAHSQTRHPGDLIKSVLPWGVLKHCASVLQRNAACGMQALAFSGRG